MTAGARAPLRTVLCALYQCAERRRVNDSGGCVPLRALVEDGALKPSVVSGLGWCRVSVGASKMHMPSV